MDQHPPTLGKKVKLLAYFRSYMQEHLIKTGASVVPRDGDEHLRLPFLRQWFRTSRAVVMHLTSGTLQVKLSYQVYFVHLINNKLFVLLD
jgi:polo-like kinase 1